MFLKMFVRIVNHCVCIVLTGQHTSLESFSVLRMIWFVCLPFFVRLQREITHHTSKNCKFIHAYKCTYINAHTHTHRYSPDFLLAIKNLIAPPKCKVKTIAKQIMAEHISLKGLSVTDAKCWFVKLWSSLELFGMEFYSCTNMDTKDKSLLGVSRDRVSL